MTNFPSGVRRGIWPDNFGLRGSGVRRLTTAQAAARVSAMPWSMVRNRSQ